TFGTARISSKLGGIRQFSRICLPRGRSAPRGLPWSCRRRAKVAREAVPRAGTPQRRWGCVVPEARRLSLCGVRPRRLRPDPCVACPSPCTSGRPLIPAYLVDDEGRQRGPVRADRGGVAQGGQRRAEPGFVVCPQFQPRLALLYPVTRLTQTPHT